MTFLRCQRCSLFFDKKLAACPDCGAAKEPINMALVNQRWESNLNAHATHAVEHG